jgi:hypothetical protein
MAGGALDFTAHAEFAFVTENRLQFSGFANQADIGLVRTTGERIQQRTHAEAADFFIIRNRQMQRLRQWLRKKVGMAARMQAIKPFMSAVPRPYSLPSRSVRVKGERSSSARQRAPHRCDPIA